MIKIITVFKNLLLILSLGCVFSKNAFAYIEPGGLFSMIGVLIASGIASLIVIKHKIINIYNKIFKKNLNKKNVKKK